MFDTYQDDMFDDDTSDESKSAEDVRARVDVWMRGCIGYALDTLAVVWTCKMRDCIVICMNVFIYVERTILQNMFLLANLVSSSPLHRKQKTNVR